MPNKDLPPDCLRILRNADAEAKRLCNPEVTPLHLAEAIRRKDDENAFPTELSQKLDHALAQLPTSYTSPVHEETTLRLLQEAAQEPDPEQALIATLTDLLTHVPTPAPNPVPTPTPTTAPPATSQAGDEETELPDAAEEPAIPQRVAPFVTRASSVPPIVPRRAEVSRILAMIGARDPQPVLMLAEEGSGGSTMADCVSSVLLEEGYDGPLAGATVLRTTTPDLLKTLFALQGNVMR